MFTTEYELMDGSTVTLRRPPPHAMPDYFLAVPLASVMTGQRTMPRDEVKAAWNSAMTLISECIVAPADFVVEDAGDALGLLLEVIGLVQLPKAKSNGYGLTEPAAISP